MNKNRVVIVFSTNEKFIPLAKGLVLSLRALEFFQYEVAMVDIGCKGESIEWMKNHGVMVIRFDKGLLGDLGDWKNLKDYQYAQILRPFLREILPGYEVYMWCDADIWIQGNSVLRNYEMAARCGGKKMAICPLQDKSYYFIHEDPTFFQRLSQGAYADLYGNTLATTYSDRPILNSGLFALHVDSSVWDRWRLEIFRLRGRNISHLAEQTALNYVLYSENAFLPLNSLHNYNCHAGPAIRKNGALVIDEPELRRIGAIHLTYTSKYIEDYLSKGLLFNCGDYLTAPEVQTLLSISHY